MVVVERSIPALFAWGRDGVPGEFESYLWALEVDERAARGEPAGSRNEFFGYGVARLARTLVERLRKEEEVFRDAKGRPPKLAEEIKNWLFLLHAYCSKNKRPAPPELLQLTFDALGLRDLTPTEAVAAALDVPVKKEMAAFLEAALIDGEADAMGTTITLHDLAARVGVVEKTVGRWRKDKHYKKRRDACASAAGKKFPDYGWSEVVEQVNREAAEGHGKVRRVHYNSERI